MKSTCKAVLAVLTHTVISVSSSPSPSPSPCRRLRSLASSTFHSAHLLPGELRRTPPHKAGPGLHTMNNKGPLDDTKQQPPQERAEKQPERDKQPRPADRQRGKEAESKRKPKMGLLKLQNPDEDTVLPRFKCRWGPLPSHIDSSQICELLCPPPGIREIMIRKGITPRNHFKDNRTAISKKSALNHAMKQVAISSVPEPIVQKAKPKYETQHAIRPPKEHAVDFVTKNMREVAQAAAAARRVKEPEAGGDKYKENLGKIPSYLIKRKIELAHAMEQKLQNEKAPKLPPGYVEMTEDDKEEVLKTLRANKAVLEKKLGALPLRWDTPSQIKTRANMDLELQDIENAIKRFSRPHVYMSLND